MCVSDLLGTLYDVLAPASFRMRMQVLRRGHILRGQIPANEAAPSLARLRIAPKRMDPRPFFVVLDLRIGVEEGVDWRCPPLFQALCQGI